jgi:polygalacturonase
MSIQAGTVLAAFNVRDYGADGAKEASAQAAIQQAIDACAQAGGGIVYFPPGAYVSGTLHLRSHVRLHLEAGATLYSSKDPASFDKRALFYAEDVDHITLEGRGTIDGQGEYEWREKEFQDPNIYSNQLLAEQNGLPLTRSFPTDNSVGHLVLFIRCKDVRIENLAFLHSPSWTMHLYACERVNIDGVYIYTSQRDGVWADGIDPDGCKDMRIANCTIETGDDAIVFYSYTIYGPALPCENITITNCRLSSSSSAIKFCDCNFNAIRNVTIDNCVITNSNRGIAFMVFDGGVVENVIISNLTIECKRFDWFWWGDGDPIHFNLIQRSEIDPNVDKAKQPPVGAIRNVILSNIIARGPGPCLVHGSADSLLENVTFDNVRITVGADPDSPWQKRPNALTIENARNVRLRNVEIAWESPGQDHWQSALVADNVHDLTLDGLAARQAPAALNAAAVVLRQVQSAVVRDCQAAPGTGTFLACEGEATRDIVLWGNDWRHAQAPVAMSGEVDDQAVRAGWS